jgi:arylsulfatase A-like enzyme
MNWRQGAGRDMSFVHREQHHAAVVDRASSGRRSSGTRPCCRKQSSPCHAGNEQGRRRNMMKRTPMAIGLLLLAAMAANSRAAQQKPNIVFLFIDDWAWNGSPVAMDDAMENSRMPVLRMPNLERLAREGMKFRNAYASPQCSPSRVCVQTGQSSPRNGFTVYLNSLGQEYYNEKKSKGLPVISCISDMTIDPDAVTIPEALKPLGYVSAHIGKWHMRGDPGDEGYVLHDGDTNNNPGNTVGKVNRLPEDLTDPKLMFSITRRSLSFMEDQVRAKRPFYLQISHYAMHEGRECLPGTRKKYVDHPAVQAYYKKIGRTAETVRRKEDPAIWLGMGEDLDHCIGAVLDKIEELGIKDNTYVVMMADNGYRHAFLPGLTQPLHAKKWWVWQGGVRVPMIVRGPRIKAGAVFKGNVVNYDLLPTFVDWAGADPKELKGIDGVSLADYMRGKEPDAEFLNRFLYFHYPHNRTSMPHSAIVSGARKVIHFYERPDIPMMFDLSIDEGEVVNIAAQRPDEHRALFGEMMRYFELVGARIPKKNPSFDPEAYKASGTFAELQPYGPFEGKRPLEDDEK